MHEFVTLHAEHLYLHVIVRVPLHYVTLHYITGAACIFGSTAPAAP